MSKNIQKVQDMVDGNFKQKTQVSMHVDEDVHANRKVGDTWTDAEGDQWEQKNGYRSKISKMAAKGIADKCPDCKSLIFKKWDKDVYKWNGRCYYCQIDYEAKFPRNIGTNPAREHHQEDSKYGQYLEGRYENFKKGYIEKWEEENAEFVKELDKLENPFDTKVANALANGNVEMTIKKNKLK